MENVSEETQEVSELQEIHEQEEIDRALEKKKLRNNLAKRWTGLAEHAANVAITRKFPVWCEGYQGTLPIELVENLDDVKKRCGGGTYILKFTDGQGEYVMQQTVIIDGDPMRSGVRIETPEEERKRIRSEEEFENLRRLQSLQIEQKANTGTEFVKAMEVMKQSNDQALQMVMALATRQPAGQVNGGTMAEHFQLFKDMTNSYQPGAENNEGMWNVIEKFVDKMGDEQKQQHQAPPLLGAAYQAMSPQPAPAAAAPAPAAAKLAPVPNTEPEDSSDPVFDAFDELAGLEGPEAWERMNGVFENLPEEKQKKLKQIFGPGDTVEEPDNDIDVNSIDSQGDENGEFEDSDSQ
jgi:hypothetical protein